MDYSKIFKRKNLIGKGAFTKAYKYKGRVYIKSVDNASLFFVKDIDIYLQLLDWNTSGTVQLFTQCRFTIN